MKTYTYYVYHIPGIKIGCTTEIKKRMKDQEFTNWEILWEEVGNYEFGWIAGDKEIELQKEYNYKVDKVHYQISRENRPNGVSHNQAIKNGIRNKENGHWDSIKKKGQILGGKSIGKANTLKRKICEHCLEDLKFLTYARWHGNNCKHKKS